MEIEFIDEYLDKILEEDKVCIGYEKRVCIKNLYF